MKNIPLIAFGMTIAFGTAGLVRAQDMPQANPGSAPPNAALKSPNQMNSGPLSQGENSFTREQARKRIKKAGYTNVTGLIQDAQGLWHARAQRQGQTVSVALDYKGDVSPQ